MRHAILASLIVATRIAAAEPCPDPQPLRAALEREARHAERWNLAWQITYTAGAVAQFAVAGSGEVARDDTRSLWVGGAKSAIGAIARFTSPLHLELPAPTGDACTDQRALRAVAERAAREERTAFWLGHLGSLVVQLAGSAILVETASWKTAVTSFALGYPVGLLTTYTMPRASWARVREAGWTASVSPIASGWALTIAGSF